MGAVRQKCSSLITVAWFWVLLAAVTAFCHGAVVVMLGDLWHDHPLYLNASFPGGWLWWLARRHAWVPDLAIVGGYAINLIAATATYVGLVAFVVRSVWPRVFRALTWRA
ncbi:hypothetical protein ACFL09_07135 [Planctomycetota bacterium]